MVMTSPDKETVDILLELGDDTFKICYQCGTCTGTCPWNLVTSFVTRKLMHKAQLGLIDFGDEELWQCATCNACVKRCPRGVGIIDVMMGFRKVIAEMGAGVVPESLRITMKNISSVGNPQGEPGEKRADWIQAVGAKPTSGAEWLYFSCCVPAYDSKVRRMAGATTALMDNLGITYDIAGTNERCCGESVRKAGSESVFQSLAAANIEAFNAAGAKKVLTTSPHCYHTFKNEYPELGGEYEVMHITQLMDQLIQEGKIKPTKELNKKVIYHDPCYLGRHNDEYEAPRRALQAIPGVELIEFPDNRESAVCCGGGGGRIWMETPRGQRFSDLRLEQAAELGADILAVACPYCMLNFDDSLLTAGKEDVMRIADVTELVLESI